MVNEQRPAMNYFAHSWSLFYFMFYAREKGAFEGITLWAI